MPYDFTNDWFDKGRADSFQRVVTACIGPVKRVLEIGSFEGRSAIWFMEHVLTEGGELFCCDTWAGGPEHVNYDWTAIEGRFDCNIAEALTHYPNVRFTKLKLPSFGGMVDLLVQGYAGSFDLIYVDGGHEAAVVLSDLILAFQLCKPNGTIVCDDYLWEQQGDPRATPKLGIDCFTTAFHGHVQVIPGPMLYQLFLRKLA